MVLLDLFAEGTEHFVTSLKLDRYIYIAYRNWNNYKLDADIIVNNKSNEKIDDKPKNGKWSPNNLYTLYSIYNQRF